MSVAASLPYFHLGAIDTGIVQIQSFGILVALGVLIGAALLRRYAEWHGISDEHIRGVLAWVTVTGFLGAHWFDCLFYQWDKINQPFHWWHSFPPWHDVCRNISGMEIDCKDVAHTAQRTVWLWLPLRLWDGIASYGGFVGGAMGFAFYVWWKRLPRFLLADVTIVGLLPAFSIGRIGCTVVSDHIGAAIDPSAWYSFLGVDYPVADYQAVQQNAQAHADWVQNGHLLCWNLGLIELLYLIPVNALVLWLAFRSSKRQNAGLLVVLTGLLYAPVRFFLDFLRPEDSDPRHMGLTFAQWISIVAFAVAGYVLMLIRQKGEPAKVVAPTSGEAQARLKVILKEAEEEANAEDASPSFKNPAKKKGADKDKDAEVAAPEVDDPSGLSFLDAKANVPFMVPRKLVEAAKELFADEHGVRAAYYMPVRVGKDETPRMVIGLDVDDEEEKKFTTWAAKLQAKLDNLPLLLLDTKQLLDLARAFDRKMYPAESEAGVKAAEMDKPNAKPFKDSVSPPIVKAKNRSNPIVVVGLDAPKAETKAEKKADKAEAKAEKAEAKAEEKKAEAKADVEKAVEKAEEKVEKADEKAADKVEKAEAKVEEKKAEAEEKKAEAKADDKKADEK